MNPCKVCEIMKYGTVIEHHKTHIHKFTINQIIYAYRGQVYLLIDKNDTIILFQELR